MSGNDLLINFEAAVGGDLAKAVSRFALLAKHLRFANMIRGSYDQDSFFWRHGLAKW